MDCSAATSAGEVDGGLCKGIWAGVIVSRSREAGASAGRGSDKPAGGSDKPIVACFCEDADASEDVGLVDAGSVDEGSVDDPVASSS